ncbi:MAG: hypothetical protein AAGC83_04830, partial [Pseudomonadota bacterium]
MNKLIVQGANAPRQVITAERSSMTVITFTAFLAGLLLAIYYFAGSDPATSPGIWFYSGLGILSCGLGTFATGKLTLNPHAVRIELDHGGLVQRGIFRSRRYDWHQVGPFAPVEQCLRARILPHWMANWYAGAFSERTMSRLGSVRPPEDTELHAADVNINSALLEKQGPKLKTTRRFCDIINEWRAEALGDDASGAFAGPSSEERTQILRRRIHINRLRILLTIA